MKKLMTSLIAGACALSLGQKVCVALVQESREEYLGRLMSPESMQRNQQQLHEHMKAQSAPAASPVLVESLRKEAYQEPIVPSTSQKEWAAAREDFRKKTSPEYIQQQDRKLQNYLNQEHARREQVQQAPHREQAHQAPQREQAQKVPHGSRRGSRREYRRQMRDYQRPLYKK